MENLKPGIENRKYPRVAFRMPVKYRLNEVAPFCGELAQDLSEGGMRIRSNEFLPLGSRVSVRLQLDKDPRLVDVEGRVVWVKFIPYSEVYQLGIEFEDKMPAQRENIARFVRCP
jgi:uncharacterized protein (TIGR02266 family)